MKRNILVVVFLVLMTLLLVACSYSVNREVTIQLNDANVVFVGNTYVVDSDGHGFALIGNSGGGVFESHSSGSFEGPYSKIVFRYTGTDHVRFYEQNIDEQISHRGPIGWTQILIIKHDGSVDALYPATIPIFENDGIYFWTNSPNTNICEYVNLPGGQPNWHCAVKLDQDTIGYLYMKSE